MALTRVWTIRTMGGGATGLEFARARLDASIQSVLVHAAPSRIRVEVDENGATLVADGEDLHDDTTSSPMSRLWIDGVRVLRLNVWPAPEDLGSVVILPGGEAGVLRAWHHDGERTAWRWQLEFEGCA